MCFSPITIKNPSRYGACKRPYIQVPCGHCEDCMRQKRNDWMIRMQKEREYWPYCYFVTLTYDDSKLSRSVGVIRHIGSSTYYSVCHEDLQLWLKRCRKALARDEAELVDTGRTYKRSRKEHKAGDLRHICKRSGGECLYYKTTRSAVNAGDPIFRRVYDSSKHLKYFICSEYGPTTLRPHYHGVFFTDLPEHLFRRYFIERWRNDFGNTDHSQVSETGAAFSYVAKYALKGSFENPLVGFGFVDAPFRLVSKGLGARFCEEYLSYYVPKSLLEYRNSYEDYPFISPNDIVRDFTLDCDKLLLRRCGVAIASKNGTFTYRLPRYMRNKIYGEQTPLSSRIADLLRDRADDLYNEKLELIRSEISPYTAESDLEAEAVSILEKRIRSENSEKARKMRQSLAKHYSRGVLDRLDSSQT